MPIPSVILDTKPDIFFRQQVQEEAARQQVPHNHSGIGYPRPQVMPEATRQQVPLGHSNMGYPPSQVMQNEQWKQR